MKAIEQTLIKNQHIRSIDDGLENGLHEQLLTGMSGSSKTLLLSGFYEEGRKPQILVTYNLLQAQKWQEDLSDLLGEENIYLYPANELISAEIAVASPEMKTQRMEVMNALFSDFQGVVIVPIAGLRRLLPPKEVWEENQIYLRTQDELHVEDFLNRLASMGYSRADMVSAPGEFSVRGGIIDVYPLTEAHPIRIDLFDTEVESMRYFNADDQRSLDEVDSVQLGPAEETVLFDHHWQRAAEKLEAQMDETIQGAKDVELKDELQRNLSYERDQLKEQIRFQGIYKYISYFYRKAHTLIDYLPEDTVIFVDEISRVQETAERLDREEAEWQTTLLEQGKAPQGIRMSESFQDVLKVIRQPIVYFSLFLRSVPGTQPQNIVNVNCKAMQQFHGQMPVLQGEMDRWVKGNFAVVFITSDEERGRRLKNILQDYDMDAERVNRDTDIQPGRAYIMQGDLHNGFELPFDQLAVITERETFTKKVTRTRRKQNVSNAERIKSYSELQVGDLVVHVDHGIGKYLGIETLSVNGLNQDYVHISYAGNDKLYVPVEQIDQVQKYVGSEDKDPKIYKLGGQDWKKVKRKVQSSVEDIADDLIKLYAEREASKGHAFSEDTQEQRDFEAAFPYQETEDQLKAIEEIKEDMERERPMDRLLCGDVGYGKTEVAIRAAFKAIMDGKQVALLVPTTILAQQHFDTFSERFGDHPINIGLLNRFRTRKQQQEALRSLKTGGLDMVIGTHRVLSKDVQFKDLGLLIVDEEQRFGVTHKEKIKQLRANIDVLTLTATPIPRTLHMSMLGVRDLSLIETPPENRFPVQTYVLEYNAPLIKEAIEREIGRGGQVFFLHNRVDNIERMSEQISMLVPDARVAYSHGQMSERELEATMVDFLEGHKDVLVTTTIIESGVDIPNVNTLIINHADKMGLSQLYQIRGRVGRSNRVAYAYFSYQRDKVLTEVAEKRLQAIQEFTELGSGFKIAMRDLSIRGAGNLLGSEQHGYIDSVGFDMYSQMLKDAIEQRKGTKETESKASDIELDIKVEAYIPEDYIKDAKQKIEMYKRFRGIETFDDLSDLQDEMIDRFGEYPDEVRALFSISNVKIYALQEGVESISESAGKCTIMLSEETSNVIDGAMLFKFVNELGRDVVVGTEGEKIKLIIHAKRLSSAVYVSLLERILSRIPEVRKDYMSETVSS
ncbi:transcription-repair coupling factor (superfamily II helicase) [Geomicrobium halophilum]|uniref:Transcription-repair-coupling factor n=1 Tax=Geomicrobium halophilum TaxID=549000 RepID=A0A841Q123_9BACL|nr:transcription-repair coupling factor [Geomicrobium halophilum]MBB6451532.1 transcription-repair coupling factor (superfamily II helicase) [Geomicrobium halophilum]